MRIVNLKTFRNLPEGTLFMKFEPLVFDFLMAKGETWECDFLACGLTNEIEILSSREESDELQKVYDNSNISLKMDFDCYSRDGCFEEDQKFAIYEKEDVIGLISKLKKCLNDAY